MTTVVFDPVAYTTAILALLDAVTGLNVYDGEVPATPPTDEDGRVHPYAVLYTTPPATQTSSMSGPSDRAHWTFQVTAVGGDRQRCSWAAREVAKALVDVRPVVAGWSSSRIGQLTGPGMGRDDVEQPPRHYVPLLFDLVATPSA